MLNIYHVDKQSKIAIKALFANARLTFVMQEFLVLSGNTEQGKCRLRNEFPFFLFLVGHWYYETKYFVFIKTIYSSRYSFVACNSRYA